MFTPDFDGFNQMLHAALFDDSLATEVLRKTKPGKVDACKTAVLRWSRRCSVTTWRWLFELTRGLMNTTNSNLYSDTQSSIETLWGRSHCRKAASCLNGAFSCQSEEDVIIPWVISSVGEHGCNTPLFSKEFWLLKAWIYRSLCIGRNTKNHTDTFNPPQQSV